MRNARTFFASFLFLPSASSRSCFFFFFLRLTFFLSSSLRRLIFFLRPSFGIPLVFFRLSYYVPLRKFLPLCHPSRLWFFTFQLSIHFSFLIFNFSFFILLPSSYRSCVLFPFFFLSFLVLFWFFFVLFKEGVKKVKLPKPS